MRLIKNENKGFVHDFNPRTHRGVRPVPTGTSSLASPYFNPRTHRGVRQELLQMKIIFIQFQSTHPSWGATLFEFPHEFINCISIHAPIVGCDGDYGVGFTTKELFQSTHPSWGATFLQFWKFPHLLYFNPRTHRGVRLNKEVLKHIERKISIHAPIVGCDTSFSCFFP